MKIKDMKTGNIFEHLSKIDEFCSPVKTANAGTIYINCGYIFNAKCVNDGNYYQLKIKKSNFTINEISEIQDTIIDSVEKLN